MTAYLILLMIPSVFAIFNTRRLSMLLWVSTFLYFVVFIGFRESVGPDWIQYGRIHAMQQYYEFWEVVLQTEPLSYLLFWISEHGGFEVYLSNVVAAVILMVGVFSFARRTAYPWLAVISATPYLIIVMGMSGIRQAMAAGVMLYVLSKWERLTFVKRGIYILVAAMFHTSALVNSVFLVTNLQISTRYKVILGSVILLITFYFGSGVSLYADNMIKYQQRYLEGGAYVQSAGAFYHIAMVTIPVVLGFYFRKRLAGSIHNLPLFQFGLYASLFVFVLTFFSSTVASRLSIYLYFLPMMIYPAFVNLFNRGPNQMIIFALVMLHILLVAGWFMFSHHAFAYVPYQTILFQFE